MKVFLIIFLFFSNYSFGNTFPLTFEQVKKSYIPSDVLVKDRNGVILETVREDETHRSLSWISLNNVSYSFLNLLIKSEDQKFYSHGGVDYKALLKAFFDRIQNQKSKRGASTISMQLINILHPTLKGAKKDLWDKYEQINLAKDLEKSWTKEQILEAYLNLVPFRGEISGLNAASFGFFKKSAFSLYENEAALLVSMLRSPNSKVDEIAARACKLIEENNCQKLYQFAQNKLSNQYKIERKYRLVNILDKSFIKKKTKKEIVTTIDYNIQKLSLNSLHEQIKELRTKNLNDGAILVLNNKTKEVLAYVPNAGDKFSTSPRFDNLRSYRQAGSTLKPFIYAKAFEENYIRPETLIDDSELDIQIGNGSIYYPKNYDNQFRGAVQAQMALGSSLNVPAVKTLLMVGGENTISFLKQLGFKKLKEASYYGPSLALGSVDISLWDLTHAYQKLAISKSIKKTSRKDIFDVLSNPENRALTFGTDSVLSMPFNIAVKTGTSKDMRDNWCVGYNENYTVGIWVGNSNGKPMWNVSGIQGAAPIFRKIFIELEKNNIQKNFRANISKSNPSILENKGLKLIKYPIDGEIIGFDNEIPIDNQQLPIEIQGELDNLKLFINNVELTDLKKMNLWPIQRGKLNLKLLSNGEITQELNVEIR